MLASWCVCLLILDIFVVIFFSISLSPLCSVVLSTPQVVLYVYLRRSSYVFEAYLPRRLKIENRRENERLSFHNRKLGAMQRFQINWFCFDLVVYRPCVPLSVSLSVSQCVFFEIFIRIVYFAFNWNIFILQSCVVLNSDRLSFVRSS